MLYAISRNINKYSEKQRYPAEHASVVKHAFLQGIFISSLWVGIDISRFLLDLPVK